MLLPVQDGVQFSEFQEPFRASVGKELLVKTAGPLREDHSVGDDGEMRHM